MLSMLTIITVLHLLLPLLLLCVDVYGGQT